MQTILLAQVICFLVLWFWSVAFATWENVVQRWNMIIDLDTWKITIVEPEDTTSESTAESNTTSTWTTQDTTKQEAVQQDDVKQETTTTSTESETTPVPQTTPVISTPSVTTWVQSTWAVSVNVSWKSELENALLRMYSNWLTKFNTVDAYMPTDHLTREQISKMINQLHSVLWYTDETKSSDCSFEDMESIDPTLSTHVSNVCRLWILQWWDKKFHPQDKLTKAQSLTLLVRIFEGKKSDETVIPRWKNYVAKAQSIGLTKMQWWFEDPITREEIALLMYRFKSIAENNTLKDSALQEMQNSVDTQDTTKIDTSVLDDSIGLLAQDIGVWDDPELRESVFWLYQQWMSQYNNADEFRAFDQIERQEAAKFIWQFHQKFIKTWPISTDVSSACLFKDINSAQEVIRPYITYVCGENIFQWQNGYFNPTQSLTKAEFIVSLIRMLGKNYEDQNADVRREPYFNVALQLGLVTYEDKVRFVNNIPITRYEVALILYRFRIKYQLLDSLNSATLENQILTMVQNSEKTVGTEKQWKVFISTVRLSDPNFNVWYIEVFDKRYKVVKSEINKVFANNYNRFWQVYDLATDKPIGSITLLVSNTTVLEWNIRPDLTSKIYYVIRKPEETNSYYLMIEKNWQ